MPITKVLVFVISTIALSPFVAVAQLPTAATATVSGIVKDANGAVVPGVKIVLATPDGSINRTTESSTDGLYVFSHVTPATYNVTMTSQGFRTSVLRAIKVDVSKAYTIDVTLEIGELAQTIEVQAGETVELQTTDAVVGNTIEQARLENLPSPNRDTSAFYELQPGVAPRSAGGANEGGGVTGSVVDQTTWLLDGIDISDNNQSRLGDANQRAEPAIPVPVESIEEFRANVTNPNATFGRAGGGQFSLVTKRGTNNWHGSGYWYHQNDNLNANTWDRNRRGQRKTELKDNRFGFTFSGPIWRDKSFFFFNYEGRRFPRITDFSRLVPTASLRAGILRFPDASGNVVSYDLATSTLCGNGTQLCDPRGLGLNPVVRAMLQLSPPGNDSSLGDGNNTTGFRDVVDTSLSTNYNVLKLDHTFTQNWRFEGRFAYAWADQIIDTPLDLRGGQGNVVSLGSEPSWLRQGSAAIVGQITPALLNEFRFGWTRPLWQLNRQQPTPLVPGTNIALNFPAGLLDEAVDSTVGRTRIQFYNEQTLQFVDNAIWVKGRHTFQGGGNIRQIRFLHTRGDKVFGASTTPLGLMEEGAFFSVPSANRPRTCGGAITTNCLRAGDVGVWNDFYAASLGIIDSVQVLASRDGDLEPLSLGSPFEVDSANFAYEFYFNDTWRVTNNLTLGYGLMYQWQAPPKEKLGRQTFITNNETCNPSDLSTCERLTAEGYIEAKRAAALAGRAFNPQLAYIPVNSAGTDQAFEADRNNLSPRIALAWNPSIKNGLFGKILGNQKTVLRGGYAIVYDRTNSVSSILIPMLGVGFGQVVSTQAPTNGSGQPFRIGVDGPAPLPGLSSVSPPIVPPTVFSEIISFQMDPEFEVGTNHSFDFTVQRQLPANMVVEAGWIARFGRNLVTSINFNSVPFFHLDTGSGQSFAQAFDLVAGQLRNGITPANVNIQPWFENQLFAGATRQLAASNTSNFINGNISNLFQGGTGIDRLRIARGLTPYNNLQVQNLHMRTGQARSNYHAFIVSLRKRRSYGIVFDFNYTFSKSLDNYGRIQNSGTGFATSFFPDYEYGLSSFDRTHIANFNWLYDLPLNRVTGPNQGGWINKLTAGWYLSGIVMAYSGLPRDAFHTNQAFGGQIVFAPNSGAIPIAPVSSVTGNNSVHSGVTGSGNVGTLGNPAAGGTGLNLFQDPEQVFNNFRHIRLSEDTRVGRGVLRGLPHWNLDMALGKRTNITEKLSMTFQLDFFNALNRVEFNDPSLSLTNRSAFGVITSQFRPVNRTDGARAIQVSMRFDF
jgi:hypothetical protein